MKDISNDTNRFAALDALRGIAAFSVMIAHYTDTYTVFYPNEIDFAFNFRYGGRAVELFFILSGFVIFFSITHCKNTWDFVKRRFIRLFPTYWTCLIITFITVSIFGLSRHEVSFREFLFNFTMIPQVFGAQKVDYAYWTLVPEFFFYTLIAIIFYLKKIKYINWICLFWLLGCFIHTQIHHIKFIGLFLNLNYGMYFIAGIMLYQLKLNKNSIVLWIALIAAYIIGFLPYLETDWQEMTAIILIYSMFIIFVFKDYDFLNQKILLFFGKISFALYLLHQNIGYIIMNYTKAYISNTWIIVLPILVSISAAYIITQFIEAPIMRYLKIKMLNSKN